MVAGPTPLIGMSMYREVAVWGVWTQPADLLPARYADCIRAAGGVPVLLPAGAEDVEREAEACVQGIAGLVITGGADVAPELYGAARHPSTDRARTDRDAWEIGLVHAALTAELPLLAICRGLQVLNVALGGTLVQHLPDAVGHHEHRGDVGNYTAHEVHLAEESDLAGMYGPAPSVPTHHHQAIEQLGDGLRPVGWTPDGTIEAVTCESRAWVRGVQWHPEVSGGQALFGAFVEVCGATRAGRP